MLQQPKEDKQASAKKERIQVVKEIPTQEVRTIENDKEIIHFITIEESLTAILNPKD